MEKVYRLIITGPDMQDWEDYNDKEAAIADAQEAMDRDNVDSVMVVETTVNDDGSEDYDIVFEQDSEYDDMVAEDEPESFVDDEAPIYEEPEEIEVEECLTEADEEPEEKEHPEFDENNFYNDADFGETVYQPEEEVAEDDYVPEVEEEQPDWAKQDIEKVYPEEASNEETIWVYQFPEEFNNEAVREEAANFNLEEEPSEGNDDDICFKGKYSDLKAFAASYQYLMNADYLVPEEWFSGERIDY